MPDTFAAEHLSSFLHCEPLPRLAGGQGHPVPTLEQESGERLGEKGWCCTYCDAFVIFRDATVHHHKRRHSTPLLYCHCEDVVGGDGGDFLPPSNESSAYLCSVRNGSVLRFHKIID